MPCSIKNARFTTWVAIKIAALASLCSVSSAQSEGFPVASLSCGTSRAGTPSYINGFIHEMENLVRLIDTQKWGVSNVSATTPPMYGLAQCYDGLSRTDCLLCYAAIRTRITRCLPATSARIYLDGCFLRYDNQAFYDQSVDPVRDSVNCTSPVPSLAGESSEANFSGIVGRAVGNAAAAAISGSGFGVSEAKGAVETVYAMAQCWKTVSREGCRECLEKAANGTTGCAPKREGRGLNAGCYLRYSTVKFYGEGADSSGGKGGPRAPIYLVVLILLVYMLCNP